MNIVNDSRILKEGDIFILEENAISFLSDIINKKPSKIITSVNLKNKINVNNIELSFFNNKQDIVHLLQNHYILPSNIYAITGTNGKTSTASFVSQFWKILGTDNINIGTTGVISTNNINIDVSIDNTTPSIFNMYRILHQAKKQNIDHIIFEASSHGLLQGRIDGININKAGFTNITQDHLDYHHNMQNYFEAKLLLFSKYLNGMAIINSDIAEFEIIKSAAKNNNIIDYGYKARDIKIINKNFINTGFEVEIMIFGNKYKTIFPVISEFQIYNICAAIGFMLHDTINIKDIINIIPLLKSPIGRMENIENSNIYVDYAHTPDALEKALLSIKNTFINEKVVVVFGCGGDRDKTKRPLMGEIANKLADFVILTDDNPRTENPDTIRNEIKIMIDKDKLIEIGDRLLAIKYAIEHYHSKCIILIAGKGHEDYQIINNQKYYFSDQDVVRRSLLNK